MKVKREIEKTDTKGNPVKRTALTLAGHFFVGMGIIGALLPVMPTTIFLILAAGCYAKSSPRFHTALINNRIVGKHLVNYLEKRRTPVKVKITTISFLWFGIVASIVFTDMKTWVIFVLLIIAIGVTWHIVSLRTYRETSNINISK